MQTLSFLRQFVEEVPTHCFVDGQWTWEPQTNVDASKLVQASPTTEYSSVEGSE